MAAITPLLNLVRWLIEELLGDTVGETGLLEDVLGKDGPVEPVATPVVAALAVTPLVVIPPWVIPLDVTLLDVTLLDVTTLDMLGNDVEEWEEVEKLAPDALTPVALAEEVDTVILDVELVAMASS